VIEPFYWGGPGDRKKRLELLGTFQGFVGGCDNGNFHGGGGGGKRCVEHCNCIFVQSSNVGTGTYILCDVHKYLTRNPCTGCYLTSNSRGLYDVRSISDLHILSRVSVVLF